MELTLVAMKVTYYLEIVSSWCHWAEPTWAELRRRFADRVTFEWKIALMRPEDFPISTAQCDWFYQRSGLVTRSPYMLSSRWFEVERKGHYEWPNLVAEAGKDFGFTDDRLRLALTNAALRSGKKIGDLAVAATVAAQATGLDAAKIRAAAETPEVMQRAQTSTAEFLSHQIGQRPAFVLTDSIGDKAVFSGLVGIEPLAATIEAMLRDTDSYAAYRAHRGAPPEN